MRGRLRLALVVPALVVTAGGAAAAFADVPAGSSEPDPWTAVEHLQPYPEGVTAPGWWAQAGATVREAVADEWDAGVRGGYTGSSFPGFVIGWRRVGGGGSTPTHDRELRLVVPWKTGRVSAGARLLQRGRRGSFSVPVQIVVRTGGPFVAGTRITFHPGSPANSVDASIFATAARGRWMGALAAGPGPGYRGSLGLTIADTMLWVVGIADLDPFYGLHFRLGRFEVRTESAPNRALGAVTRVRLVWTGTGS